MGKNFSLSANIETGVFGSEKYIVTANAEKVADKIVNQYRSGVHSFTIIGTYGTGKSCFLLTIERDLIGSVNQRKLIKNPKALSQVSGYDIINIVGEYMSLEVLINRKITKRVNGDNTMEMLHNYYNILKKQNKMLVIVVDEFGKVLEHAAKNNVEQELYFMQQLAEFANVPNHNILLLTTLHQNFSAYASKLSASQKTEWTKVKGRFQEVVFVEPVDQLLYMAAETINNSHEKAANHIHKIFEIAQKTKILSPTLKEETLRKLYPLDAFSANIITKAIQRYGQNERSLFSFLNARGANSLFNYKAKENCTYGLSEVYDYLVSNFYSYLSDANSDSMGWSAIITALERVEYADWKNEETLIGAIKTVKSIGLLNMLGGAGFNMQKEDLCIYMNLALGINDADSLLNELIRLRIIRFAEYKGRYILFEGTDVNIEEEICKASAIVPIPTNPVDDLRVLFNNNIAPVKAEYYKSGTPRYFEYVLHDTPLDIVPTGDVDGYIEIIFSSSANAVKQVSQFSAKCSHAIIFALYKNADKIIGHLHKIQVYDYIREKVLIDDSDKVAIREITQLKSYEQSLLNKEFKESLFSFNGEVIWYYNGQILDIKNQRNFNELLSDVCKDIYCLTPTIKNELINRHKLSGSISAARVKYLQALVKNSDKKDLEFDSEKFPPEKAIYYTLLKNTGLHVNGEWKDTPTEQGFLSLWEACEKFLASTKDKSRKVSELIKILSEQPYKIKTGVLDFWIPTYLWIKRLDYSLFGHNDVYIPEINMEFFDLLKKRPAEFSVKAYAANGVKMEFYKQYRKFINADINDKIRGDKFIETIKPFFYFYNHLNDYAKHTHKFDHVTTLRFRDVLAKAKDPEKTFFEDLPEALGYDKTAINNEKFVAGYCQTIQMAVRELRSCYRLLIDRIEGQLINRLDLQSYEYAQYITEIRQRLSHIKEHLLSNKQRDFYSHAMTMFDNRQEWYQSICYVAIDQPLERLRDEQEEQLVDNIVFLFRECEKHSIVSEAMSFTVTDAERKHSYEIENKIEKILSDNNNLNIYALMNVLKKKMK